MEPLWERVQDALLLLLKVGVALLVFQIICHFAKVDIRLPYFSQGVEFFFGVLGL